MSRFDAQPASSASTRLRRVLRRSTLAVVAGAGAAALLAGCGAGQISETAKIKPAVQGANASSADGSIALRDLSIAFRGESARTYNADDNASLVVRIANAGDSADTLTSVSSDAADSVVYVDNNASSSPSSSASSKASGTPSASPSEQPPGKAQFQLTVPAKGFVPLLPDQGQYLQLVKLKTGLQPGQSVALVFHFRRAGSISVNVPVASPDSINGRSSAPAATAEPGNG